MDQPQNYKHYYYASARRNESVHPSPPPLPPKKNPQKKRPWRALLIFAIVVIAAYLLVPKHATKSLSTDIKKVTASSIVSKPKPTTPSIDVATLSQGINNIITANSGITTSVSLIDLNTGQTEHYGTNNTFLAASTAKIITAEAFLHEVETGDESLTETINGNNAEYELKQMIVVSDDNTWEALNNEVGYTQLQDYAAKYGVTDYQSYDNVLTSSDTALMLQKLWNHQLLNDTNTQLLLSWLQQANYRQYVVPAIPTDDTIYHKVGIYEDGVHDATIITHGSRAFVLVIYTNGNGIEDWPARATMMQSIAKVALHAYFGQ